MDECPNCQALTIQVHRLEARLRLVAAMADAWVRWSYATDPTERRRLETEMELLRQEALTDG